MPNESIQSNFLFGFNVKMKWFLLVDPTKIIEETYHNITEIHYNYDSAMSDIIGVQIAFESDIHQTGFTRSIKQVVEYEAKLATQIHSHI